MAGRALLAATQTFKLGNIGFDSLSGETLLDVYRDGRAFSHFVEPWLAAKTWRDLDTGAPFTLTHVRGCKDHDFSVTTEAGQTLLYDAKTFTKRGCKFMPSSMIGTGRKFDAEEFRSKVKNMAYIVVDNVDFPAITVKFATGESLARLYPNGYIPVKDRVKFFARPERDVSLGEELNSDKSSPSL
jgi:hypothetical protein